MRYPTLKKTIPSFSKPANANTTQFLHGIIPSSKAELSGITLCTLCDIFWNICLNNKLKPKGSLGIWKEILCMISQCIIAKGEFVYDYCWSNCSTILLFQGSCFSIMLGLVSSFLCLLMGCRLQCIIWNIYIVIYWGIFQIFSSQGDIAITKVKNHIIYSFFMQFQND